VYPDQSSESASLYKRATRVLPGGNTRHGVHFAPYPIYQATGDGCRIMDVDGVERIDFVNNWSSTVIRQSQRQSSRSPES
jgi:glutamate-1-semialdehyde 2,1-aminomutase